MAGTDGRIADLQAVDQRVGLFPRLRIGRVQAFLQIGEVLIFFNPSIPVR